MDVSEYTKPQGEFLKADHVNSSPESVFEIMGESHIVKSEKFNVDRLHIPVSLGTFTFTFDCSKTNARVIKEKLGTDTTKWVGKHLKLETYKTKTSDGKLVEALNVKEVL